MMRGDRLAAVTGQSEQTPARIVQRTSSAAAHHRTTDGQNKDQDFYFNFYSSLQNQLVWDHANDLITDLRANMIGDISRTGTYRKAILGNAAVAFQNKIVLDVGAGEWISVDSNRSS